MTWSASRDAKRDEPGFHEHASSEEERAWKDCVGAVVVRAGNSFVLHLSTSGQLVLPFERSWQRKAMSASEALRLYPEQDPRFDEYKDLRKKLQTPAPTRLIALDDKEVGVEITLESGVRRTVMTPVRFFTYFQYR